MTCVGGVQEEQITRNILASWQVQRSMHSEVKKVLEVAKRKKRNERVVRLVDAAATGDVAEVSPPWSSPPPPAGKPLHPLCEPPSQHLHVWLLELHLTVCIAQ